MQSNLAKSAQAVQEALNERGLKCCVMELPDSARTALDAAQAIGCDVAQIVKSLAFKTRETQKPLLLLVSGPNSVDEELIASYVSEPIMKADANYTRDITGYAIGGIPPLGHKLRIEEIYIDEDLTKHDVIWAAAGTPHAVFSICPTDLINITQGKIKNICR